jgi:hypothetical protein
MFYFDMKIPSVVLFLTFLVHAPFGFAQSTQSPTDPIWTNGTKSARVAVLDVDIKTDALDKIVGESVASVLASELALLSKNRYTVISRNEIKSMVSQQIMAQSLGCVDAKCMTDLAEMASADFVVSSSIGKVEAEWVFTLELIESKSGNVLRRQAATYLGSPDGLIELCRPYVTRLVEGTQASEYKGSVQVLSSAPDAVVHVNEKEIGSTPIDIYAGLPVGRHRVEIKKPGYLLYKQDVVIHHNETTLLQAELIDEDSIKPWYSKWWVWTSAAAVVTGSVLIALQAMPDRETTVGP